MSQINILDKSVFSLISAGEVVERPASVVKELVENSIDAGATNISIEITFGGIDRIKVVDNGIGISKDDLPKAFLPHATSKIKNKEDLEKIGTLGFRGEALSSIAIVSKVTAISKTNNFEANKIVIHGGEIMLLEPASAVDGTTFLVENIFYNVPARAKFLKKPKQEESEITNYVSRLMLANPDISIKYVVDDKLIFQTNGNGLYEAIYAIYGKNILDNLIKINHTYKGYRLIGYVGKPSFSKPNRTYQTLIVNGRYVINQSVSTAAYKAFENYLMKGNFPFYVLNLYLPFDNLDVNVHPNKLDVKFENSNEIFMLVLNAISEQLFNIDNIQVVSKSIKNEPKIDLSKLQTLSLDEGVNYSPTLSTDNTSDIKSDMQNPADSEVVIKSNFDEKYKEKLTSITQFLVDDKYTFNQVESPSEVMQTLVDNSMKRNIDNNLVQENLNINLKMYKIVGTVFNTYIIVEKNNELLIIDQHAAHERILFDQFKEELKNKQIISQPMIVPFVLDVNSTEKNFIENNQNILNNLGFEIELFGNASFKVSSVPMLFKNIDLTVFFNDILKDMQSNLTTTSFEILADYLAKKACRSAVKANDLLTENEINVLFAMLTDVETLLCPHGRPIIVKITNKEIEKWFKRTL